MEKYNLGSPGRATDKKKKKSCLLIAIQTEIRSPSAGELVYVFLGTIKLITWQPIGFYNLSRHLTEGCKRELLQHKARCGKASRRQQGFGPSQAPTGTASSVDVRCPFPSLYRDPSAVARNVWWCPEPTGSLHQPGCYWPPGML